MAERSETCCDVADILPVDQDAAAGDVVEAKQQPRDRGFSRARRPDNRNSAARRHLEADALQDRPRRLIGERDILEADVARPHIERFRIRLVLDLRIARQDREHGLDVGDRLLDLAIDHAHEIERLVQLDHHRVDHHEIADRVGAGADAVGAHHHGGAEPEGEDHRLAGIEHGERGVSLHARLFVALHRAVVALRSRVSPRRNISPSRNSRASSIALVLASVSLSFMRRRILMRHSVA